MLLACDKDNNQEEKDIRLGVEDVNEVSLNKLSTRMILLTGGTGKYTVNVADSKIASASISKDTLRNQLTISARHLCYNPFRRY